MQEYEGKIITLTFVYIAGVREGIPQIWKPLKLLGDEKLRRLNSVKKKMYLRTYNKYKVYCRKTHGLLKNYATSVIIYCIYIYTHT